MNFVYFFIVLLATSIGAISGFGGGMIIKPFLDAFSPFTAQNIGLYSSLAVFCMTIISTAKQIKQKTKIDFKIVIFISIGSAIGGIVGQSIFKDITHYFNNDQMIKTTQSVLLLCIFILIFIYTIFKNKIKTHNVKNLFVLIILGIFLGSISVFLGIGGGALDVVALTYFFSFKLKDAVVYSLATILFSQISKLSMIFLGSNLSSYDFAPVPLILIGGIAGGIIGGNLRKSFSETQTNRIFLTVIGCLIVLTTYNVISRIFV